jgi:hypothetical protein
MSAPVEPFEKKCRQQQILAQGWPTLNVQIAVSIDLVSKCKRDACLFGIADNHLCSTPALLLDHRIGRILEQAVDCSKA